MSYFRSVCQAWENFYGSAKLVGIGLAAVALLLLTACETIQPPPQRVDVPIGVSCLPAKMPVRPQIATESELAQLDDYKWTLAIFLDRRALLDYVGELEAVLLACR